MRRWPIHIKLLAVPLAVTWVLGAVSWLIPSAHARAPLDWLLAGALIALLMGAWITADSLTRRIAKLRDLTAQLQEPSAPHLVVEAGTAAAGEAGDELARLARRLRMAIYRSRERERELRRSSAFLEFAQGAGGFGIFDLNPITFEIVATPLFFELTGLPVDKVPLKRDEWLATIHPEDLEPVVRELGTAIAIGGNFRVEYRSLRLDRSVHWLGAQGRVCWDGDGEPSRVIGTLTDITERKHLEETLRHTSESLNIAQTAAGVATMDFNFLRQRFICSDNFRDLMGIAPGRELNDPRVRLERVHPEDQAHLARAAGGCTPVNPAYHCEYRLLLEDGRERWIAEKAQVMHAPSGEVVRVTGALIDITDLKRSEEAMRTAEQAALDAKLIAEEANRAKTNFLANVTHEIRTPMNGVIGMVQILAQTSLNATQREYVEIIDDSAQALLALLNDVLDLSKIDAERLELEEVDYDLRDVIYDTASASALQAAAKGLELVTNIDSDVPVLTRGDPARLRQITMNLVGNAIKFTHEGHVVLHASSALDAHGQGTLRIEVSDTGIGIPPDRLDRLFRPFSQVDSSTTRHYGGTGLGLSIVKRLAQAMGGEVGVESEVGRGSRFWVSIPAHALAAKDGPRLFGTGKRVLVVDDLEACRRGLLTKLALYNFEAVAVGSVDEALERLALDRPFDIVLADELMPVKGGLHLLSALRTDPRHAKLPFVLLSLFGSDHAATADWPHQPDAVGLKPIRALKLATLLDKALRGESERLAYAQPSIEAEATSAFRGRRILLVEDNPVNQRVAQRLLLRLAAEVTIANHGGEALERLAEAPFDAVLMDCQMPVMDGFTATERIRERERLRGGPRIPIIALTANVGNEDRQRCIAAGMDAHLGKPIVPGQLADCLARYLRAAEGSGVDLEALHEVTGGDSEFERELIDTFVASGDQCLADIAAALAARDLETIGKRAHALKGASANIHAFRLNSAASNLESAARSQAEAGIEELVHEVSETFRAVHAQLRGTR